MIGFKPRIYGIGSDRFTNCATTVALNSKFLIRKNGFLCFRKRRKRTGSYDLTTSNLDRLYFIAKKFYIAKTRQLIVWNYFAVIYVL